MRIHFQYLLMGLALSLSACGGSSGGAEAGGGDSSSGGEAEYAGPIASTDVEKGKEAFDNYCGDCHPDGGDDVGPSLIATPHTPAKMRQQVREGSGKMRPFPEGRLAKEELEDILAWLASVNAVK